MEPSGSAKAAWPRLIIALAIGSCGLANAESQPTSSLMADNAVQAESIYRERLAEYFKDPGNFSYSPMEPLRGSPAWKPLPMWGHHNGGVSVAALEKARTYAQAMNSSAFIVWRAGKIEAQWFAPGTGPTTPLLSKSLSKPLTAIAVGRAIALGKIRSLDQSIADFIPSAKGTPKERIKVRYLLDMRSGMLDQGFSTDPEHPLNRAYLDTNHGSRIIADYPMPYEPGERYSYANAPSDLVAMVIEGATGMRYGTFLEREVLRRLGAQGGSIWVNRPGGLAHSGCCTFLPADTYLRMAILLIDDGQWRGKRLLPQGYVAQMRKGTPQNPNFGLGLWLGSPYHQRRGFGAPGSRGPQVLHSEPFLDPDLFMFDGNSNQVVAISPANHLIVLRLGATPPAPQEGRPEWDNAFLPNTIIRGLRALPDQSGSP